MAMHNRLRKVFKLSLWIVALLVYTVVLIRVLHYPNLGVVHEWKQPDTLQYDGMGPYYLSVVKADLDWRGFPINVDRNYLIYAGRESGSPSHGHIIDFSFQPYPDDLETFLSKAQVTWTEQGVELALPSGHRLFIPQAMFTGGR